MKKNINSAIQQPTQLKEFRELLNTARDALSKKVKAWFDYFQFIVEHDYKDALKQIFAEGSDEEESADEISDLIITELKTLNSKVQEYVQVCKDNLKVLNDDIIAATTDVDDWSDADLKSVISELIAYENGVKYAENIVKIFNEIAIKYMPILVDDNDDIEPVVKEAVKAVNSEREQYKELTAPQL